MNDQKTACHKHQQHLLEGFLAEGEDAKLSSELSDHLRTCDVCRRYREALASVTSGFPEDTLYSPFIREKTLRRMTGRAKAEGSESLPLIILAALLSLSISFVIPGWLLSKVYGYWTSSSLLAYGAACGTLLIMGGLGTVITTISLAERGYICFNDSQVFTEAARAEEIQIQ